MSIEERAKEYQSKCFGIAQMPAVGYIDGAREQREIDEEMFCMFLSDLRESNGWEGREWKFTRLWCEYKSKMEEVGEQ